jgi:alcohol dehydrogenase (cytochrome c)
MYRRAYNGWGYSPLSQITPQNARRLKLVWTLATGQIESHEAPPIVNNGVMFVATPGNHVLAIDAKAGNLLWRFKRPVPEDMLLLNPTSRGVGLLGDKVYFAAADAVLIALNAKTGKEVWTAPVEDYAHGYSMSLAPLVADGKVMVGVSGGELGVRDFIAAFDAETGKPVWKTYTVPAPGEPGSETWPKGDQWKTGGGSVWIIGNYDPQTNLSFWGTGNGGPWMVISVQGIISSPRPYWLSILRPARSKATTNTIRTIHWIGTRSRLRSPWIISIMAGRLRGSSMLRATAISGCLSAPPTRSTSSTANPS